MSWGPGNLLAATPRHARNEEKGQPAGPVMIHEVREENGLDQMVTDPSWSMKSGRKMVKMNWSRTHDPALEDHGFQWYLVKMEQS